MADYAHELTDRELSSLEKRIKSVYVRAGESVRERADSYLRQIKPEADKLVKAMNEAADDRDYRLAKRKYQQFLREQTVANKRFIDLQEKLAAELTKYNQQVASEIAARMNGVFSLNHNFAAYTLEHDLGLNLQFTLYDERAVERLLRDQPKLLPKPKIDIDLDKRWNRQKISGEIAQAILTGDPIERIADRLQHVTDMNRNSAVNNARTAITSAENAGRIESYHYAESIGITLQKEWLATLDDRTRDEHRILDGQRVGVDEPFEVDGAKIMFPGDPEAEGYLVYGCRCTLVSAIEGVKDLDPVYRRDNISGELLEDKSYKEWADEHNVRVDELPDRTEPITASDQTFEEWTETKQSKTDEVNEYANIEQPEIDKILQDRYDAGAQIRKDVEEYYGDRFEGTFANAQQIADRIGSDGMRVFNSDFDRAPRDAADLRQQWGMAGFYGREPIYVSAIRYGDIPESGFSTNWAEQTREAGVSVIKIVESKEDLDYKSIYDVTLGYQGIPKYEIRGWYLGRHGADGEPLLLTPKVVRKL